MPRVNNPIATDIPAMKMYGFLLPYFPIDTLSDKIPKIQELPEGFIMEDHVKVGAYYLSKEGYDYNELCWILAEKIMKESLKMPSIEDIRLKAEQVFASSCTYDELCWLNAEIDILRRYFFEEKTPSFFD